VSHLEQRINSKLYQILRLNLVPFIKDFLNFAEYSESDILNIAGILDTNCFDIVVPSNAIKARGIYFQTAMMAHDCVPNTKHFVNENLEMNVIATIPIKKGEMILTTYTHPLKTTVERQRQLKEAKCFDCLCLRCKDPTEMKTFSSGLKCGSCKNGIVVSLNALDRISDWSCAQCGLKIAASVALNQISETRVKLEAMNKRSVKECEEFLNDFESILPSSSVFMIDVKYALSLLYGNVEGFSYEGL
jgi:hypothetical protein